VGKSSLVARYIKGEFLENYNVTVGVEYATKIVNPEPGKQIRLQIWDTVNIRRRRRGKSYSGRW
jgi:Ras-related protein Rab-2A